jgi:membrane-bound lytic murein transglycosylase A
MKLIHSFFFVFILLITSCSRAPLKNIQESMRPTSESIELKDYFGKDHFFAGLKSHIEQTRNSKMVPAVLNFGKIQLDKETYLSALEKILEQGDSWLEYIKQNFYFFEVYGRDDWSEVFVTGYYEPRVNGSKVATEAFSQALYRTPEDFIPTQKYLSRDEIDSQKKLYGKNLELAWVRPFDAFLIQIQGSGLVVFEDQSELRVGYANQNGHKYEAIGKHLTDIIPLKEMTMQKIRAHLETLSREDEQKILNLNPSYVFFQELKGKSLTYSMVEVIEDRTIATDKIFFPKGALAFLDIEAPLDLENFTHEPRFVFDQDTGGAIKGGGRVDLYFGSSEMAAMKAGVMKREGKLFYLVPKLESLPILSPNE